MKKLLLLALACLFLFSEADAQGKYTKDQILGMSIEELSDLPLEDLMAAVETLGVSSVDELFAMIMNKNVASASKKEENAFTSPLSTTVITRDEMRSWGVSTIEEAFRLIPGVVVQEKTNGVYDVYIRGLNNVPDGQRLSYAENQNTLLMVDGRDVTNYIQGAVFFETLPVSIEDVDRVEVVRGASSALYGQNAVQGVINIITDKPSSSSPMVQGSIQTGNQNSTMADIALRKALNDKFAFGLSFNAQTRQRDTDKIFVPFSVGKSDKTNSEEHLYTSDLLYMYNEADGSYTPMSKVGHWVSVSDLSNIKRLNQDMANQGIPNPYYNASPYQYDPEKLFSNPDMSRETYGTNLYLALTPAEDVRFDLTAGYQNSNVITTDAEQQVWSTGGRASKSSYANLSAAIKDLHANISYNQGPIELAKGVPGYKIKTKNFRAGIDYDINIGNLSIRPAVAYNKYLTENYAPSGIVHFDMGYDGYGFVAPDGAKVAVSNLLKDDASFSSFSPSVRLDYKVDGWRFIGAYRLDKTDNPDKANHSWQAAISKEVGLRNFLRVSYGRSTRSANLMNSDADFTYDRYGMNAPRFMLMKGSEYDLVSLDGVEFGWRSRPNDRLLIDAEFFYSKSSDYSAHTASEANFTLTQSRLAQYLVDRASALNDMYVQAGNDMSQVQGISFMHPLNGMKYLLEDVFNTATTIQTTNLPLEATQFGASVNLDWIVSSKLIAKFNVNFQRTIFDNYYLYNQEDALMNMVVMSYMNVSHVLADHDNRVIELAKEKGISPLEAGVQVRAHMTTPEYMQAAGVKPDPSTNSFYLGNAQYITPQMKNDHLNKATPSIYGMLGLIYKPISQINIAAFGNVIGRRTYFTAYGSEKLSARYTVNLKVGYKPTDVCEVFFNAHNLFNNEQQEYVYMDKIGGLYSFGVNFKF